MSNTALTWAFSQVTGSATAKLVLVTLADCMNDKTKQCNPSIKSLVEKTELSERTVHNQLSMLETSGFISIQKVFSETGKSRPNHYWLNMGATNAPIDKNMGASDDSMGASDDSMGAAVAPPLEPEKNQNKNQKERERVNARATPHDGFNKFWEAYPRKVSKNQALKVWAKINPDEHLQNEIMEGLQTAKTLDRRFHDDKYTPYPATWLNAEGWLDEHVQPADRMNQPALTGYSAGLQTKENPIATSVSHASRTSGYTSKTPSKFISKQVMVETNTISNLHDWLDTNSEVAIHG